MLNYRTLVCFGSLTLACSSGLNDDEGSGANGGRGSAPIIIPGAGNTGSGNGNGSITNIPPEEVNRLRNSSCAGWSAEPEALPGVLQLVVDISSSMNNQAPGSMQTRWEIARSALLEAIVGVGGPGLPADIAVGLLFYPNRNVGDISTQSQNVTACVQTDAMVPLALLGPSGAQHRTRLDTAFRQAQLNQSTPTHDAYRYALNNSLSPTRLPGSKFMLLITDGAPTLSLGCMNPSGALEGVNADPIVNEVEAAADQGIRTFLIGVPGSEPNRAWMSRAARLGGTASTGCSDNGPNYCHMDLTRAPDFSQALRDGLAEVTGQIVSCTYELPAPPPGQTLDASRVNIIYTPGGSGTPQLIGRSGASCEQGWQLNGNIVSLCESTCDAIKADSGARLELLFGCAAIDEPPR